MPRLTVGDTAAARTLPTAWGDHVRIPDPQRLVHLQFRRYAGCPVCNLHLRSITTRREEIAAAGIRGVVVFHSTAESIAQYQNDLPLTVVADPDQKPYAEFGVEAAPRSVLDPRAWPAVVRGIWAMRSLRGAVGTGEQHLGLPADLLIDTHGHVVAAKHGAHANNQWSVNELLTLAKATT
ncbi:MAG: redoxin domain-containing protein [Propionibacteriales bacterium]|nr:redoxin domain-containing protein [Propionibacteriales bacterium]